MDSEAELERIRQSTAAARQRIRRLDVLLDEQERMLDVGLPLGFKKRRGGHLITGVELRVFGLTFGLAGLAAFLAGYWTARFH